VTADAPTSAHVRAYEAESAAHENLWRRSLLVTALCLFLALAGECGAAQTDQETFDTVAHNIKTVFVIVMENHNWTGDPGYKGSPSYNIKDNPLAPYINNTLLPQASYASNYRNVYGMHPSLPNYLWMEAGTNFGIKDDAPVAVHHQTTHQHLAAYLDKAGITWKVYDEAVVENVCPLKRWHDPFVFFDDMTDNQNPKSVKCILHNRPLTELASNLKEGPVARYNFIVPGYCHSMHDICNGKNRIQLGDEWLASIVPTILDSDAYKQNGVLFITWDESRVFPDGIIPMIVLSPLAKGGGYTNTIKYDHGSLLRTLQEIFVPGTPLLRDAKYQHDLRDMFITFP
jgi:phospholipase C